MQRRQTLAVMNGNRKTSMAAAVKPRQSMGAAQAARNMSMGGNRDSRGQSLGGSRPSMLGRPSMAPGQGGQKDPRDINDKAYKKDAQRNVTKTLMTHGYEYPIGDKMCREMNNREFQQIVNFLMLQLDHNFEFKTLEELPTLWKMIGYQPGWMTKVAGRDAMKVVGGPGVWPQLLAALDWLCELVNYKIKAFGDHESMEFIFEHTDDQEKYFMQYVIDKYSEFMTGKDEDHPDIQAVEEGLRLYFEQKNCNVVAGIEGTRAHSEKMKARLAELAVHTEKLQQMREQHAAVIADEKKFNDHAQQLVLHTEKTAAKLQKSQDQRRALQSELDALTAKKEQLAQLVSTQPVAPLEATQMRSELERHKAALAQHDEQRSALQAELGGLEAELARGFERVDGKIQQCQANESRLQVAAAEQPTGRLSRRSKAADVYQTLHAQRQLDHTGRLLTVDTAAELLPGLQRACEGVASDHQAAQDRELEANSELNALQMRSEKMKDDLQSKKNEFERLGEDDRLQREQYISSTLEPSHDGATTPGVASLHDRNVVTGTSARCRSRTTARTTCEARSAPCRSAARARCRRRSMRWPSCSASTTAS